MSTVIGTFPTTQRIARGDVKRRRLVSLVFLIYGLLILEGAIRKWVLPEAGQAMFFIRVRFTLLLSGETHGHQPIKDYAWLFFGFCLAAVRTAPIRFGPELAAGTPDKN